MRPSRPLAPRKDNQTQPQRKRPSLRLAQSSDPLRLIHALSVPAKSSHDDESISGILVKKAKEAKMHADADRRSAPTTSQFRRISSLATLVTVVSGHSPENPAELNCRSPSRPSRPALPRYTEAPRRSPIAVNASVKPRQATRHAKEQPVPVPASCCTRVRQPHDRSRTST